jgi:hypothetical protein
MQFEPIGGFPSIILIDENNIKGKTLETRGFVATNIVNISDIMDFKKKENLFLAFGSEDDDNMSRIIENTFTENPHDYQKIDEQV